MNDGVKILLERMKTHPEEFVSDLNHGNTKWSRLVDFYENVLTHEEKKAIKDGIVELNRAKFTEKVLEMLMDEPPKEEWWNRYNSPVTTGTPPMSQLQEEVLRKKEKQIEELVMKEYWKNVAQQSKTK